GRQVALPLTSRTIPIVGDAILVDREFGTGAVKITPAHDFNDFEAGERHGLPRIRLLDIHAHLKAGFLAEGAKADQDVIQAVGDLPVTKARPKIEQLLAARGLLEKVEPHKMALGKCYRCKTVVEPFLSDQWFVKIKPLARPAIDVVEHGDLKIIPEAWKNNYLGWMRDIKDWCISRQIWWGHQIPAWYCEACHGKPFIRRASDGVPVIPSDAMPIVGFSKPASCPKGHGGSLVQDPDVLDTWFSSALWPFSTLGWPEQTADLKKYYPTSTLVTGLDILFFWVARMIMMGLKFMGEVPFREVYIHALVRDAEGQKMSKSKGNVIDPLHVMEQYGTDALRFTLASMSTPGRDIKLAEERIEGYRNFANKIWNAARFILMNLDGPRAAVPARERSLPDRWILARLSETIGSVSQSLEHYRFDQACSSLYQFVWHEYCDWYLELAKVALQQRDSPEAKATRQTLAESSELLMRLLHPFMPFLTEEIWQTLPHEGESVMIQRYPLPNPAWEDKEAEETLVLLQQSVGLVRTGRSLLNYSPAAQVTFFVECQQAGNTSALSRMTASLSALAKGPAQVAASQSWPSEKLLRLTRQGTTIGLTVMGEVDLQKALARIAKQRDDEALERARLEGKLKNQDFAAKAPPEVVAEHQQRLALIQDNQAILDSSLTQLASMLER
ncbi:MAG TPA: valine--tRNA ligase, partial [Nitrospiraceae bacterium]|nr:valine--tRNA ligase [Nitrospiraceae bacterium]